MLRPSLLWTQASGRFFGCFWLVALPVLSHGGEGWKMLGVERGEGQVCLKCPADREIRADRPFIVITHGMRGTQSGDRFHALGETIASIVPEANVVLIDWSEAACASFLPQVVAWSINSIADEACDDLRELGFQAEQATMVGESFGAYVNARIATNCGQVKYMIAMNPASVLGGYPVPDLRLCSRLSWSFHTYSVFDTLQRIADRCIIIETAPEANEIDRHTAGIRRLKAVIGNGYSLVSPKEIRLCEEQDCFDAIWTFDGRFEPTLYRRIRPALDASTIQTAPKEPASQSPQDDSTDAPNRANQALNPCSLASR